MVHVDRQEYARRGADGAAGGSGCAGRVCASQEPQEVHPAAGLAPAGRAARSGTSRRGAPSGKCSMEQIRPQPAGPIPGTPPLPLTPRTGVKGLRSGNLRALFMKGWLASRASGSFFFFCFSAGPIGWISIAARQGLRGGCSTLNNLFFVVSSSSSRSCTGGGLIRPTYSFVNNCLPGATGTSPAATRSRPVRAAQLRRGLKPARQGP